MLSRLVSALMCVLIPLASSLASDDRGREIFARRDAMDQGWIDSRVSIRMELRAPGRPGVTRRVSLLSLEGRADQGDRVLLVFEAPTDVAGTALLTHDALEPGASSQWLYLPAYKRTRRIAPANRRGRFMGTEFIYEDLLGDPLEDFSYAYLGQDDYGGQKVHHIERVPLDPNSAYSRQETWVDPDSLQVLKAVLFDRDGNREKIFEAGDWQLYQGRHWRAHKILMTHVASGRSTLLTAADYELNTGLRAADFKPSALQRLQ